MANPIVDTLTTYVEEQKSGLIAKSVLGAKSASILNLMTGVKGATTLNLLSTDIVLQNGAECGWNADGDTEISQRVINPQILKVNHAFCPKTLLKTYANHMVKVAAGQKNLPFEEEFTNGISEGVAEAVEKMIWQGQKNQTDEFEGFISILTDASVKTVSKAKGTSAYATIKEVYMALPERAIKADTAILVGAGLFRQYIQELVAANLYHYNANDDAMEYTLPGTAVKVIAVNGLNETASFDYVIAGRLSNFVYGISGADDDQILDAWYSKDNDEFRVAVEFIAGVQVAYPSEVVMGKIAK